MTNITTHIVDNSVEKLIVTGMIVSEQFLKEIQTIYSPEYIVIPFAKTVASWCLDYYKKYQKAPGKHIQDIFNVHVQNGLGSDQAELIKSFLTSISHEYERADQFNTDYLLSQAEARFKECNLKILADDIGAYLSQGKVKEAEELLLEHKRVERPQSRGINPLTNREVLYKAIEKREQNILFNLPDVLGKFIGPIERSSFTAILGPEKRGKCLSGDSLIILPTGEIKTIENVYKDKDKYVLCFDEVDMKIKSVVVKDHLYNGKKPCFSILTRTGRKISATSNHPFLTLNGWVELKNLKIGDKLAVPKNIPVFGNAVFSNELVELTAFLLADGGLTNGCTFTNSNTSVQNRFKECVNFIGDSYTTCPDKYNLFYVVNNKTNKYKHNCNNTIIWLKENRLFPCASDKKKIPQKFMCLNKEQTSLFLKTLFSLDGTIYRYGIEYCSASEDMIRQIMHLLLRFGIVTTIFFKTIKGKKYWILRIRDKENMLLYLNAIGFSYHKKEKSEKIKIDLESKKRSNCFIDLIPYQMLEGILKDSNIISKLNFTRKIEALKSAVKYKGNVSRLLVSKIAQITKSKEAEKIAFNDVLWDEIVAINNDGYQDTFDLSIPKHHNFIANDIVVHNSWMLLQSAMWAVKARCNVAFFEIGDMTEGDVARRLAIYNTRTSDKHYGDVLVPVLDCLYNQKNECIKKERTCDIGVLHRKQAEGEEYNKDAFDDAPNYRPCKACQFSKDFKGAVWYQRENISKLTWKNAWEMGKRTMQRAGNKEFKLVTYPNDSVNIRDIELQLDHWEQTENFIPDMIIIDYADNLASLNPKLDERGSQNKTWKAMRALSQKRFCAVITATQADADSYDQKSLKERNFSEDKRKYGHVTGFITLNQTPEEKDAGIMRIGRMFVREDKFNIRQECTILQCLDIGRPYLDSFI